MTPAEQIAYLREWAERNTVTTKPTILAVCDLAERALAAEERNNTLGDLTVRAQLDRATVEDALLDAQNELQRFRLTDDEAEAVRRCLVNAALLADAAAAVCSTAQPAELSWHVSPEVMVDLVRAHTEYDDAADRAKAVLRRLLPAPEHQFQHAFIPAEPLEALLAAVGAAVDAGEEFFRLRTNDGDERWGWGTGTTGTAAARADVAGAVLAAAYRAYVEAKP